MTYSAIHKKLLVEPKDLSSFSTEMLCTMANIRKAMNIPLTARENDTPLAPIDHIERGIIDALLKIGVDLGVKWGCELDLTKYA